MPNPVPIPGGALAITDPDTARAEQLVAAIIQVFKNGTVGGTVGIQTPATVLPAGTNPSIDPLTGLPQLTTLALADANTQLFYRQLSIAMAMVVPAWAAAAGTLTSTQHKTLLQLIHFISDGPAEGFASGATKTVTGTVFPTNILWRRADATKLVERIITWTGPLVTVDQWKMYDTNGTTVLATVTDTISYTNVFESSRVRVIT